MAYESLHKTFEDIRRREAPAASAHLRQHADLSSALALHLNGAGIFAPPLPKEWAHINGGKAP